MESLQHFLSILVPLVIIMDPLGNLPLFILFTEQNSEAEKRKIAANSALAACAILMFFALTGDLVLRFFDISLPAFQLAGGFIFFIYALQLLRLIPSGMKTSSQEEKEGIEKENVALVPLATPLLAGPGAITAVLVWQHGGSMVSHALLLLSAIVLSCLSVFLVFLFGRSIANFLGVGGIRVITRLMGLLLSVIAVEYMVSGLQQILRD